MGAGRCRASTTACSKRVATRRRLEKLREFNDHRRLWRAAANAVVVITQDVLASAACGGGSGSGGGDSGVSASQCKCDSDVTNGGADHDSSTGDDGGSAGHDGGGGDDLTQAFFLLHGANGLGRAEVSPSFFCACVGTPLCICALPLRQPLRAVGQVAARCRRLRKPGAPST